MKEVHVVENVGAKLASVRKAISTEYNKQHSIPWVIAYSGGKDSTLLLQLAWEAILASPKEQRRKVYIVSNDTLVESPLVVDHLKKSLALIERTVQKSDLPIEIKVTTPCIDQTFWVNVIGRGYIPPTRNFRWCTDRMKIEPTNSLLKRLVATHKKAILLIGTRKSESQNRKRSMEKHGVSANKMNPHSSIDGCRMFAPLADLTDDQLWMILMANRPPWGGTNRELITLYRNASGGECPLVLSKEDAPSCGTTSPRFGCWTCTVVTKDKSLMGLIESGYEDTDKFQALAEFRDWLISLREDDNNRLPVRRDGRAKLRADGKQVMGPFRFDVRQHILERLQMLEKEIGEPLISVSEIKMIQDIWRVDKIRERGRLSLLTDENQQEAERV